MAWLQNLATVGPPKSRPAPAARLSHQERSSACAANLSAAPSQVPVKPRSFIPDNVEDFAEDTGTQSTGIPSLEMSQLRRPSLAPSPQPPSLQNDPLDLSPLRDTLCEVRPDGRSPPKHWWEALHMALSVCAFAGGPPVARHLAATSRALFFAIREAWGDIARQFPCRLYVMGGIDNAFRPLESVLRFDPSQGSWETLPPFPTARAGPAAVVFAGRVYVFGGEAGGRALQCAYRFDPCIGCWERLPPMQEGRIRAGAVVCGEYVYALGGLDGAQLLSSAERFCPSAQQWEALPAMQRARYACAAAVYNGSVFAFGGDATKLGAYASTERFNPNAFMWELLPLVNSPPCKSTIIATSGAVFALGGVGLNGQSLAAFERVGLRTVLASNPCNEDLTDTSTADASTTGESGDSSGESAPRGCHSQGGADEKVGRRSGTTTTGSSNGEKLHVAKNEALDAPWTPPPWEPLPPMQSARHLTSVAMVEKSVIVFGGKGPSYEAMSQVEVYDQRAGRWQVLPPMPDARIRAAVVGGRL